MGTRIATILLALLAVACGEKPAPPSAEADYAKRMATQHANDTPAPSPAAEVPPAAPIASETVQYAVVNGRPVSGYVAYPASAEGGLPAVLLFHEWWGLNGNIRSMADQLAGQGYVALAADLYAGRVADTPEVARSLMEQALGDPDALAQNLRQAAAWLRDQAKATRLGTIGWCFGGGVSLQAGLQLADRVDAVVIYYGHVGSDRGQLKALQAPVLGLFGGADQGIPVESVRAFEATLRELGKDVQVHVYDGASHAFANPSGSSYQPEAAADAWKRALEFLAERLKNG